MEQNNQLKIENERAIKIVHLKIVIHLKKIILKQIAKEKIKIMKI